MLQKKEKINTISAKLTGDQVIGKWNTLISVNDILMESSMTWFFSNFYEGNNNLQIVKLEKFMLNF